MQTQPSKSYERDELLEAIELAIKRGSPSLLPQDLGHTERHTVEAALAQARSLHGKKWWIGLSRQKGLCILVSPR